MSGRPFFSGFTSHGVSSSPARAQRFLLRTWRALATALFHNPRLQP
jgi:hypothetical protein